MPTEMPNPLHPDGTKGVPVAMFPCWDVKMLTPHYAPASRLKWYDGNAYGSGPGWYCYLCMPEHERAGITLAENIRERGMTLNDVL